VAGGSSIVVIGGGKRKMVSEEGVVLGTCSTDGAQEEGGPGWLERLERGLRRISGVLSFGWATTKRGSMGGGSLLFADSCREA